MNKATSKNKSEPSWISKNPKKTGLIIFLIITFLLLFLVDRLMNQYKPTKTNKANIITRAIGLSENHPNLNKEIFADETYLALTDNLVSQNYPFRTDSDGYLLPANTHANPDYKILFLGGSTTECMYVSENKRFPYLAGQLIEDKTNKLINSYNSGVSGNNTIQSIDLFLNKIIPLEPDIMVIMHAINDYATLAYDQTYWPLGTPRSELFIINDYFPKRPKETLFWHIKGVFRVLFPNIHFRLHEIKDKILSPQQQSKKMVDEWADSRHKIKDRDFDFMQEEFRWAIQLLVTATKTHNILPVLMTQANRFKDNPDGFILKSMDPLLSGGITYETFKKEYDAFNEIIRDVAKENEIPLIDLAKLVPQEKEYMYDVLHYNDRGSILVANIISDYLINSVINAEE